MAASQGMGRKNSATSRAAISAAAVARRVASVLRSDKITMSGDFGPLRRFDLVAGAAEAPLAGAIGDDRRVQRGGVEVRPQRVGEIKLGVGELPEQKIADALLATGADEQIRLGREAHGEISCEGLLRDLSRGGFLLQQPIERLQDVPAPAIIGCDGERQALVARGQALSLLDQAANLAGEAPRIADHPQPHAAAMQLLHLVRKRCLEQLHQERDLVGRTAPVFGAEGEQRQVLDAALGAGAHRGAHRLDTAAVAGDARQVLALGPATVAVHDDRDMARYRARGRNGLGRARLGHTAISSASFCCSSLSMSAICRSVIFCTSSCARRSSFSETSFFLSASLRWWIASRRRLRTATRAFSASCRTTLISSLRRSSVSTGIGTRTVSPAAAGLRPRSESRIAFSIACASFFSKGVTPMVRASSSVTLATWLSGV